MNAVISLLSFDTCSFEDFEKENEVINVSITVQIELAHTGNVYCPEDLRRKLGNGETKNVAWKRLRNPAIPEKTESTRMSTDTT